MYSIATGWMWAGFLIFILLAVGIDIFLIKNKKNSIVSIRESLTWLCIWIACALIFNGLLWCYVKQTHGILLANQKALEFFTGFLIEKMLSVDNLFVFIMIFNYFSIDARHQQRVLLYGVLGAVVLRLIMILGGTWLVGQFHWILYLFGVFLIITGSKMLFPGKEKNLAHNPILSWLRKHWRITDTIQDEKFFIKKNSLWYVTPLFLALILIEVSDVIFALDSIPAIFSVTKDAFIIFTSNIFAILGLRSLYFFLANMTMRFYLLKYAIAVILVFIGAKMLLEPWITIPISIALGVIIVVLLTTVILSLMITKVKYEK